MFTDKDMKYLRCKASRRHILAMKYIAPFGALILLAVALLNTYTAMKCADKGGTTLLNILMRFELDQEYSGSCMKAVERFLLAISQIFISAFIFMIRFFEKAEIDRSKKLLAFIEMYTKGQESGSSK